MFEQLHGDSIHWIPPPPPVLQMKGDDYDVVINFEIGFEIERNGMTESDVNVSLTNSWTTNF